ncbi:MAG: AAA family ATPase [Bacteroidales bacterium]|nr:AAA family ATPase [Bacteroidales bacterium]
MKRKEIIEIISGIIPQTKTEGDLLKKRTIADTYHVGGLSGNRLNSGTLRSQFIVCEKEVDWMQSDISARRAIHSDQRIFVQKGEEDIWDVYKGASIDAENMDPILIYSGEQGLERLLEQERKNLLTVDITKTLKNSIGHIDKSLQQIYYGAPGTGKSHIVKKQTERESVVRTTFHPDSDYSTFVGCYKPTIKHGPRYTSYGEKAVVIKDAEGKELTEDRIVYEFVDQAFLQSYIKAWKFYTETLEGADPKKQFLIIEEINRGNCAQIFGDLFQLLDRNDYGFSDYYIHADRDMQKHLAKAFNGIAMNDSHKNTINAMYHNGERDIVAQAMNGEILLLPNNLYIWATMNTSDQSLFPIDSAFKRRWDWKYRPIVKGRDKDGRELNWRIKADTKEYDWWSFLEKINAIVGTTTNSEDKKLGFFFCKPTDSVISAETFVGKVIFYLWNDVFKNFGFDDPIFKDEDGSTLEFDRFYMTNINGDTIVRVGKVEKFLDNLKVKIVGELTPDVEIDANITITVNDKEVKYVNAIPYTAIENFVHLNPDKSAQEIVDIWKDFKKYSMRSWIICNKEEHDSMDPKYAKYSYKIDCTDGESVWVNKDGWMYHPKNQLLRDTISEFIKAVNTANLGISIKEIMA